MDLAEFSPSAFAGTWLDCKCVEPVVVPLEKDGTVFYVAVMVARKDSGITSIEQMKGHSLAWADPNSASGYLIPSASLKAAGIDLADGAYFSRTGFAGGHEQGIVAVLNKQYDAAVTWTSGQGDIAQGFSRGALRGMVDRGMLKMADVNIIWRSGKIPNGPWALRSALPTSLKAAFTAMMLDLPKSHKDIYDAVEQGSGVGYVPATLDLYKDIIDLRETERRRQSDVAARRTQSSPTADPTDDPAYRLFQQRFASLRRSRQTETALIAAAVVLLFVIAAVWTDFSPEKVAAGLPRIGEYFGKLFSIEPKGSAAPLPVLALSHLFGGVKEPQSIAYWFYRINVYVAAVADHPDGHPCHRVWFRRRLRSVFSRDPHICRQPHHRLRHPPFAGGDADHPAGRARLHPGLALRHRPARRHPGHRHPHDRGSREIVLLN